MANEYNPEMCAGKINKIVDREAERPPQKRGRRESGSKRKQDDVLRDNRPRIDLPFFLLSTVHPAYYHCSMGNPA